MYRARLLSTHSSQMQPFEHDDEHILQPRRMNEEDPGQFEAARYPIGERLYPACLRRVMPGVNQIDSQFLSQSEGVMRTFTGNESIHPFGFCLGQIRSRASRNDPYPSDPLRPCMTMPNRPGKSLFDSPEQSRVIEIDNGETTHSPAFELKKSLCRRQSKIGCQENVVSDFGMSIQRKVGAINC